MSAASKSLIAGGAYLLVTSAGLLFAPNQFLGVLGMPGTSEPWVRVLGVVTGVIGYYYIYTARKEIVALYPATVQARVAAAFVLTGLVIAGIGPSQLLLFGAIDFLTGMWTHIAMKRDRKN